MEYICFDSVTLGSVKSFIKKVELDIGIGIAIEADTEFDSDSDSEIKLNNQ